MKQIFLIFLIFIFSIKFTYSAEKSLSTNILNYNPCDNSVTTTKSIDFKKGDLVLIIQMNGAIIDRSNTENYGDIIDLNGVGQFELNEILSIDGENLKLKYKIKDGYDFSAVIQFIKVPKVKNLTISQQPVVKTWDGETGGVLVLYAEDTLTLETDIDVSGKGFRGGVFNKVGDWDMAESDYFYELGTQKAGFKGEGIVNYDTKYVAGMGKNANGGGGGNAADAGGGGGGNWSSGGNGGYPGNFEKLLRTYKEMGKGGKLIGKLVSLFPIILGGGGGGSTNHNLGTGGVSGGGIVFIFTKYLKGNDFKIISNGSSVKEISGTDGSGGGGGGGSVFVNFEKVLNKLNIELIGCKVGDTDARGLDGVVQRYCHGPGGGGSGGSLFLNKESIFILSELYGGKSGLKIAGNDSCTGTSYVAQDGEMGKRIIPKYVIGQDTKKL